jgi:light-independent protochlorophyllide reductase subunit N
MHTDTRIIRENGHYISFCPLSCVSWLMDKNESFFFLSIGSVSCAYFIHRPRPLLIYNEPRLASIILEEEDIAQGFRKENLLPAVKDIIDHYAPKAIFLLGSCFIEIQKIDLKALARFLGEQFPCTFVPVELSGFQNSYSSGEDALLSSLLDLCPAQDPAVKEAVIVGAISSECREMFEKEFKHLGIPLAGFLPAHDLSDLPRIGENTLLCPVHPYLIATFTKAERTRKCKILESLFPIGIEGTHDFLKEACAHFGISSAEVDREAAVSEETLTKEKAPLKDKKFFIMGDNMFELPIARFLSTCGAIVQEAGTPYVHPVYHRKEVQLLQHHNVPIVESPDCYRQEERIKNLNPDVVIAPLGFSYPLEAQGYKVVWSVKFYMVNNSIYGFENVKVLLKIFTHILR